MQPLSVILLLLAMAQAALGGDASIPVYGASPGLFYRKGTELIIGFNLRKAGEPDGMAFIAFPEKSQWRSMFEQAISTDDLNALYYSIQTKEQLPKTGPFFAMPVVDLVTDQVLHDINENSQYRSKAGLDTIRPAPDSCILSIKPISQNDFLNVNPRIIPDPNKSK